MSFFGNRAINRVIAHTCIQTLAQNAGGVFLLAYLLKAGVPLPIVFCTMSAMTMGRFMLRSGVLVVARRFGLRATLILGTLGEAAIFPILPHIHRPGWLLAVAIAVGAVGSVFYWTSYHAYFAIQGDAEHRGSQVGAREALSALVNIVAPALGGWALVAAGPEITFWSVAAVQALAVLPLLGAPDARVARDAPGGFRAALMAACLQATDGWFAAGFFYVWQIALFVSVGERFSSFGAAMALAGIVGAAGSLGMGRLIDLGHGRRSVVIAYVACAITVVLKALWSANGWLAVVANALGAMCASALLVPVMMARIYNLAKRSPCPMRFHMTTEAGWDLGCAGGCLAAAGMTWAGLPLSGAILLSLAGAAAGFFILVWSYPARAPPRIARPG